MPSLHRVSAPIRIAIAAGLLTVAASARAEVRVLEGEFNGIEIRYRVLLPDDYDSSRTYPVVMHFAGGPQTWDIVERSTDSDWREHAEQRGIVVVAPAAPREGLYFRNGDRIFPDFLAYVISTYRPSGGKVHITGHSNGGLSAFHIGALYPDRIHSITGYPGLLGGDDADRSAGLRGICLYLHVGADDGPWRNAMESQHAALAAAGHSIDLVVEPDQGHRLDTGRDELAMRLFDELTRARTDACR